MMPVFPSYIFIDDSTLQRSTVSNVLKSQMEVGPQKTRPIQSIPMFGVSLNVSLCADDLLSFRTWFRNEVGSGAYWFLMNDPFDGVRRRFRFAETEFAWSKGGNILSSNFVLESYDEL